MKKLFFIIPLLFFVPLVNAQSWQPVGSGMNYGGYVNSLFVHDSVLYAGGVFTSPGNNIAQWNGLKWDSLGSGVNNEVNAISYYKDKVYVGGFFSNAGGHAASCIATWNGTAFSNAGMDITGGDVAALQVYDSLLYIGGDEFDSVNHTYLITRGMALWDGTIVKPMGTYPFYTDNYAMAVYDGNLYEGQLLYGYNCMPAWNNVNSFCAGADFYSFFLGNYSTMGQLALTVCNGDLYCGGIFDSVGSLPTSNIARWNGLTWSALGSGINGTVYALASYKNLLFAGGSFDSAGGIPANNIAMWDGTKWTAVGVTSNGLNGPVYALAVFDSNLYAGGAFTSPGNGIAEFVGPLAVDELKNNYQVNVYPNPNNGLFSVSFTAADLGSVQAKIEIYNVLGEKIYSSILINENTSINLGKQPAGIYLYRIITSDGKPLDSGKLVIE